MVDAFFTFSNPIRQLWHSATYNQYKHLIFNRNVYIQVKHTINKCLSTIISISVILVTTLFGCNDLTNVSESGVKDEVDHPATSSPLPTPTPLIFQPLSGYLYHGVYPGGVTGAESDLTPNDLVSYEESVGKQAAWVFFSHNWFEGESFPLATASWIRDAGSIPYIRLMLWSDWQQYTSESHYSLQSIIDGKFDQSFAAWCADARDFASPLIAEYGVEVNGEWFPWNGIWNGAGAPDSYGDPAFPDGPERFRDAYRHIIQICREQGADNITWVFHANYHDWPEESWNRMENYYPGDDYIDWLAVSVYGAQRPLDDYWEEFSPLMDAAYTRLDALSPHKPIILAEFGVTDNHPLGSQALWAETALRDLTAGRWPRLIGFSWWNERWQNDDDPAHDSIMRVQDNPALREVFIRLVGQNDAVLGTISGR